MTTLDLYDQSTIKKRVPYATPRLAYGSHTLEVRVTGTKRAASLSTRLDINAFVAWP